MLIVVTAVLVDEEAQVPLQRIPIGDLEGNGFHSGDFRGAPPVHSLLSRSEDVRDVQFLVRTSARCFERVVVRAPGPAERGTRNAERVLDLLADHVLAWHGADGVREDGVAEAGGNQGEGRGRLRDLVRAVGTEARGQTAADPGQRLVIRSAGGRLSCSGGLFDGVTEGEVPPAAMTLRAPQAAQVNGASRLRRAVVDRG